MRCPLEQAAVCKDCDGYGTNECDHCGREGECETCDGSGRSGEHLTACEWCEAATNRGKASEFFLRDDIAEIIRADALARIPSEAQRFIIELAKHDAIAIAPAVVHEDLVVFAVRRGPHAARVAFASGEGKMFLRHNANTPDTVGAWFSIAIPAFRLKSVEAAVADAIARRAEVSHAAA